MQLYYTIDGTKSPCRYDEVGMSTWIGEDFDERVLSTLEAHHRSSKALVHSMSDASAPLAYSIIVERSGSINQNLDVCATPRTHVRDP